ncbi:hypothetical protein PhaeoP18_04182 (plasmid) [Phaeobacter piscinae]|uniref:Uncharacterized protein n=1 Tax=Phaeobacter piscinae TaxID=1580596 RepID=A0AAN1GX14_9RHOB|nr:hypothetical protein PhaeoP36_03944 [Phaeobacter piscinae]ATG46075.1 hypothetical protein PhaeoP13_04193 [Phaeobacter piscinae]AUQ88541.1 hypothetical protein PhaeoP42_03945 [Phaeobacter piscinae]AUR38398.1 hypothetical protein PhaeoP18_04182 [Phaeobacter piscinae]
MIRRSITTEPPLMQFMREVLEPFHSVRKRLNLEYRMRKSNAYGSPKHPPQRAAQL